MKQILATKIIVSIIVLTALIIAFSLFTQNLLYKDSIKLAKSIDEIQEFTRLRDWSQAKNKIETIISDWEDIKKIWSSLIDHQEIDNIDVTLSRLQILAESGDVSSTLSEAAALKKYINHIPDKERLSIDNLL